jgi:ribosomal protein S7
MRHGKKVLASKIMTYVCTQLTKQTNTDPFHILLPVLTKCLPLIEIKRRQIGRNKKNRRFILVPYLIENPIRSLTLAIRWIIAGARNRSSKSFKDNLYFEILETYKGLSSSESLKLYRNNQNLIFENRSNIRRLW